MGEQGIMESGKQISTCPLPLSLIPTPFPGEAPSQLEFLKDLQTLDHAAHVTDLVRGGMFEVREEVRFRDTLTTHTNKLKYDISIMLCR